MSEVANTGEYWGEVRGEYWRSKVKKSDDESTTLTCSGVVM